MAAPEILEDTRAVGVPLMEFNVPGRRNGRASAGVGYQWMSVKGKNFNADVQTELEKKGARAIIMDSENYYHAFSTLMKLERAPGFRTIIFPNIETELMNRIVDHYTQEITSINERLDALAAQNPAGLPVANPAQNNNAPPVALAENPAQNNNGYIPPVAIAPQGGKRTRRMKKRGKKSRKH